MVSSWRRASSFLSRLPPQLCERDSCGGRWSLVQVSVSLQWPAGHKSVDTADTHGAIMWQFGHPVGEMLQAVQVLTKNDKIWTPSEQTLRKYMTAGIFMRRNLILSSEQYVIFYEIWTVCWRAKKNMKLAHNDSRPFFRDVFTWPPGFKSWIFESGIELPFVKIGTHSLSSQGCVIFTCASVWLADVPGLGNVSFISFRRFCLSLVQSTWIASQQ